MVQVEEQAIKHTALKSNFVYCALDVLRVTKSWKCHRIAPPVLSNNRHLTTLTQAMNEVKRKGKTAYVIFLDIKKSIPSGESFPDWS